MKTNHTPGRWALLDVGDTLSVMTRKVLDANWPEKSNPRVKCREIVHWAGFDASDYPKRQIKANAILIAAAPRMLEALEAVVDACGGDFMAIVNEAIAEAKDGTP